MEWDIIFNAIGHPSSILDPQHTVIAANRSALILLKKSEKEVHGKKCYELFHGSDKPPEGCPHEKMLTSGHFETVEMEMERTEGIFLVSCTPLFDDKGQLNKVIHIASDITKRKKAEAALWEGEERFRTMVEQSPLSIQIMNPDGRAIMVNRAWENLWGITLEDLEDYSILKDKQLEQLGIMSYIKRGFSGEAVFIPAAEYDVLKTLGKGTRRWVQAHIYPVKDERGNIRIVVLMHEDITERKKAEEEIKTKVKELEDFYEMSIGREIKMKELKEEKRELMSKLSKYENNPDN